ncbi:hypothetical protein [Streptacidiphilus albus]|uniref:hypothetical protein n=1 Tax=Streptacidiphilus albus TaxID=105425 RepID=UPI00054B4827|nr:hypothetical protein [Streptacidiphilus albus]
MTDTDGTRYVDPDTWFERLYAESNPDTHAAAAPAEDSVPVDLAKAEPVDQAEPEPEAADEDQADSAGLPFDLRALADQLTGVLSETSEEREKRRHREREARLADAGETPAQRRQRHREERRQHERRTTALLRVHHSERARRFRRWVVLTGLSASAGYAVGLVQDATGLPLDVGVAALGACWWFDLYMRRWGRIRVSQVRGVFPLVLLIVVRIPVASVLASLLGLNQLLALSGQLFHHH